MSIKIVHVVNYFLPDYLAGTENYVFNIASLQLKKGHQVFVVRPDYWGREDYIYDTVPVKYFAEEKKSATKSEIMGTKSPPGVLTFIELIKKINPSIVHFHEINGSNGITYFHIHAIYKLGIKQVFTAHLATITCASGTLFYKNSKFCDGKLNLRKCTSCALYNKVENNLLANLVSLVSCTIFNINRRISKHLVTKNFSDFPFVIHNKDKQLKRLAIELDCMIVLTDWFKKVLLLNNFPESKIALIKQGINIGNLLEEEINILERQDRKIVFVGRITKVKGLHILIKALKNSKYPIQLDVYGNKEDANYFDECFNEARNNNVDVEWKGVVESSKIVKILKNYDALILPSYFSEMSPLVIQEAFLAGIPVIASNVYGNVEQLREGENGLLFGFGNSASLKSAIELFYSDDYKSKWKIKYTPNTFENIVEQIENIYMKAIFS